jgi:DNA-directed RNA polymerase II subunit RPB1
MQEIRASYLQAHEQQQQVTITETQITFMTYEDLVRLSVCVVHVEDDKPAQGTVNDPRMGISDDRMVCGTCHLGEDCLGHLGRIDFHQPIYHPAPETLRVIVQVLTCVCNDCGELLVSEDMMKVLGINKLTGLIRLAALEKECSKKDRQCPRKKEKKEEGAPDEIPCKRNPEFLTQSTKMQHEIRYRFPDAKEEVPAIFPIERVRTILEQLDDRKARLLGFEANHPKNLILVAIPVIPPRERAASPAGSDMRRHPLTKAYMDIVKHNNALDPKARAKTAKDESNPLEKLREVVSAMYNTADGRAAMTGQKDLRSIAALLQSKEGHIRGATMGRRNDYSGRSVISPAPHLRVNQVAIPHAMARTLTVPVIVNPFNIRAMQALLRAGKISFITQVGGKFARWRRAIGEADRWTIVLQVGDRVDRHLQTGDRIITNRQPTLHRQGIMALEVVLWNNLSAGLHPSLTTPYGADYVKEYYVL